MSTLVQVPPRSVSGDYCSSALIRFLPEELSERHTIDWMTYDDDGLGEALGAAFKASNEQYFGLVHHLHSRRLGQHGTAVLTLHLCPHESETLDAALCDLGLTSADIISVREDIKFTPCELIRQDDNGNEFCVGTYRCRADALAQQRKLAAGFHKQDYWIRKHEHLSPSI